MPDGRAFILANGRKLRYRDLRAEMAHFPAQLCIQSRRMVEFDLLQNESVVGTAHRTRIRISVSRR
jgi:hypothetical protein